ncbi:MAG: sugar transferase [Clostridia bacterium]|nr:sugar transferase [Clostridia bacterium]
MLLQSTYSGILRRRYYHQFERELNLFLSQMATICVVFYALKIGTRFSREMMFTMYFLYFVISQPLKYLRKKYLNGQLVLPKKKEKKKNIFENTTCIDLDCIDNRNEVHKVISQLFKRFIDIIVGLIGCVLLIPLTCLVFFLNKLNEEDGSVFYIQERIGQYGKPFKMFKFRSMVVDADEKLERFLEENEDVKEEFMMYRKIKNDPRVTKVGEFLRRTSLDEFPQFINVLLGDMSIVRTETVFEKRVRSNGSVL